MQGTRQFDTMNARASVLVTLMKLTTANMNGLTSAQYLNVMPRTPVKVSQSNPRNVNMTVPVLAIIETVIAAMPNPK